MEEKDSNAQHTGKPGMGSRNSIDRQKQDNINSKAISFWFVCLFFHLSKLFSVCDYASFSQYIHVPSLCKKAGGTVILPMVTHNRRTGTTSPRENYQNLGSSTIH